MGKWESGRVAWLNLPICEEIYSGNEGSPIVIHESEPFLDVELNNSDIFLIQPKPQFNRESNGVLSSSAFSGIDENWT